MDRQSPTLYLVLGILHHLDNSEALHLFRLAKGVLKPGGRLLTNDGCDAPNQSRMALWLLAKDRGKNVRTADEYLRLARTVFAEVTPAIRSDLAHIPCTWIILDCPR